MADYVMEEAVFPLPEGWVDGTTNIVVVKLATMALRVMVLRVPSASRKLEQFMADQLRELGRRMAWFTSLGEGERLVHGFPAKTLRATYKDDDMSLYQHRVVFAHASDFVALTVIGPANADKEVDVFLEQVIGTIEFRSTLS